MISLPTKKQFNIQWLFCVLNQSKLCRFNRICGLPIKLVIVDDYHRDLDMFEMSFVRQTNLKIIAQFQSAIELFEALQDLDFANSFDLLLLDINMPVMNGLQALEQLMKHPQPFRILMMSHGYSAYNKTRIHALGCMHYSSKDPRNLLPLIPLIMAGETGFEYHYTQKEWQERTAKENLLLKDDFYWTKLLSYKEKTLIRSIAMGLTNKQLAHKFANGTSTIKRHKKSIFVKLGISNKAALIEWAKKEGLG